ncbi:hypothetical protein CDAR_42341 [Caerostris darwini]|uniref:Uncharacterized protein n=1 Tax=Caerostris darwini TaxID=1538125 RepID=A0AAV4RGI6_9ARAC|nr:hypothetical protein CDAR_42341 [Caerostris darwini]
MGSPFSMVGAEVPKKINVKASRYIQKEDRGRISRERHNKGDLIGVLRLSWIPVSVSSSSDRKAASSCGPSPGLDPLPSLVYRADHPSAPSPSHSCDKSRHVLWFTCVY